MRVKTLSAAAVLTGAMVLAAAGMARAAPASADRSPTKVAEADTVRTAATEPAEDDSAGCSRSRKRLWIESEGWVVRRVTICR